MLARVMGGRDGVVGIALVLLAAVLFYSISQFPPGSPYDVVGPKVVPSVIAGVLAVTGACIAWGGMSGASARQRAAQEDGTDEDEVRLGAPLAIAAGVLLMALTIKMLGWIVTAALLFAIVARAFGSSASGRDVLIGLALSGTTYAGFHYGLGLHPPVGWLVQDAFALLFG